MRIKTIALLATSAAILAACGVQPGSAEWCKGVIQGTIKADQAQLEAHSDACEKVLMEEMTGGLGGS